jgi:hypothetical protein
MQHCSYQSIASRMIDDVAMKNWKAKDSEISSVSCGVHNL